MARVTAEVRKAQSTSSVNRGPRPKGQLVLGCTGNEGQVWDLNLGPLHVHAARGDTPFPRLLPRGWALAVDRENVTAALPALACERPPCVPHAPLPCRRPRCGGFQ